MATQQTKTPEHARLEDARTGTVAWKSWGPYLSERQWGTVREDYSAGGDAWNYFSARPGTLTRVPVGRGRHRRASATSASDSACRWRSGTANDPILKERMFGLNNGEGNHGEDVKEYWFYLDSTPTHSYLQVPVQVPAGSPTPRGI